MIILCLSQTTSLTLLSQCKQAGLEGQEVLKAAAVRGTCGETKQLQAVPSYLQVISSAPDQQQAGYFIYLETWIDMS